MFFCLKKTFKKDFIMEFLQEIATSQLRDMSYEEAMPICDQCGGTAVCIGGGTRPKFAYRCDCGNEWQQIKPKDVALLGLQKTPIRRDVKGGYKCTRCGQPKKGHVCPMVEKNVVKVRNPRPDGFKSCRKNKPQRCTNCFRFGHKKSSCIYPSRDSEQSVAVPALVDGTPEL
jgi:hypothetical protein